MTQLDEATMDCLQGIRNHLQQAKAYTASLAPDTREILTELLDVGIKGAEKLLTLASSARPELLRSAPAFGDLPPVIAEILEEAGGSAMMLEQGETELQLLLVELAKGARCLRLAEEAVRKHPRATNGLSHAAKRPFATSRFITAA